MDHTRNTSKVCPAMSLCRLKSHTIKKLDNRHLKPEQRDRSSDLYSLMHTSGIPCKMSSKSFSSPNVGIYIEIFLGF